MDEIEIFEAEASIADKIKDNVITIASVMKKSDRLVDPKDKEVFQTAASTANPDQVDLFYFDSILVSTGWNKNDDVFDAKELWDARATPVDKQVNFMHDEKTIIGHMTDSFILNQDGEIVAAEKFEDLPDKFDIAVSSVIYTAWADKDFRSAISNLIEELSKGNWYVSMEARFPAFDYAIETPDGEQKVIARNKDTAFLSKHLAVYGGNGEYEGYKVGRLLRGLYFSGKGVVDKPANERSVILSTSKQFTSKASLNNFPKEKVKMEEELKKEVASLKTQLSEATAKLADVDTHKAVATKLETELKNVQALVEEHKTALAAVTEELSKVKAEKAEMEKEKEQMAKEKCKANRVSQLVTAGLDQTKAEEVFARFETASDDQFASVVELYNGMAKKTEAKDDEEMMEEKCSKASVKDAEEEKAAANAIDTSVDQTEEVAKAAVSWLSDKMFKTRANKSEKTSKSE